MEPKPDIFVYLAHHGVKGQNWGVRRGPPYPLDDSASGEKRVEKTDKPGIIKTTISGHDATPKKAALNSIIDHVDKAGHVDVRTFYDEKGWKAKDIHTTDHGHPKQHETVPHVHEYTWNEDGTAAGRTTRDLTDEERKENDDIL